jgi:membrane AbrB-like protein
VLRWPALLAATVAGGWVLDAAGLPSAYLFAALLAGLAMALAAPGAVDVPPPAFTAAQAVTGVVLGAYLKTSSLRAAADAWLPVTLVSAGTLGICLAVGIVLGRRARVDGPTAVLGMIAGGASGIVAMARELGGDDRLVAFMQYLRVLIVVLLTPLIAGFAFGHEASRSAPSVPLFGDARGWLITLAAAPVGALIGRAIRLPAGTLLGPLALAGTLALAHPFGRFAVPELLQQAAFIGIGLQVGLRFTADTVREVGRLLGPVILAIVALMVACFGLALALTATTDISLLDAYLATTPGGLYAVLAAAFGAGADTTFILAVQTLRLLVMVLLAPLVVRWMVRPTAPGTSGGPAPR